MSGIKDSDILNTRQSAKYMGVNITTIYPWIKDGFIPHEKVGKKLYRFKKTELDSYIQSQRIDSQDESTIVNYPMTKGNKKETI